MVTVRRLLDTCNGHSATTNSRRHGRIFSLRIIIRSFCPAEGVDCTALAAVRMPNDCNLWLSRAPKRFVAAQFGMSRQEFGMQYLNSSTPESSKTNKTKHTINKHYTSNLCAFSNLCVVTVRSRQWWVSFVRVLKYVRGDRYLSAVVSQICAR